jgi:hypothetical protein
LEQHACGLEFDEQPLRHVRIHAFDRTGSLLAQFGIQNDALNNVLGSCCRNDSDDVAVLVAQEKKLAVRDCWFNRVHDMSTTAEGRADVIHDRKCARIVAFRCRRESRAKHKFGN